MWPWMADIQSSLRRLQESIRGLSDASALVGAAAVSVHSGTDEASDPDGSIFEHVTSPTNNPKGGSPSIASTPTFNKAARHQRRSRRHGERASSSSRGSTSGGGGAHGGPPKLQQQEQQQSFLSSIGGDLRESAEVRFDFDLFIYFEVFWRVGGCNSYCLVLRTSYERDKGAVWV